MLTLLFIFFRTIKFQSSQKRKVVVEEEIVDEKPDSEEPNVKTQKFNSAPVEESDPLVRSVPVSTQKPTASGSSTQSWNRSVGVISRKNALAGLVKIKKQDGNSTVVNSTSTEVKSVPDNIKLTKNELTVKPVETVNSLSLLGAYSGTDSNDSE